MYESTIAAVTREVKEELNLEFLHPRFLFFTEYLRREENLHSIVFFYEGTAKGSITNKVDENSEFKYFDQKVVQNSTEIAWNHKDVLLSYFD